MSRVPLKRRNLLKLTGSSVALAGAAAGTIVSHTRGESPVGELTADGAEVALGEQALIEFSLTNIGEDAISDATISVISKPEGTEHRVTGSPDDGEWELMCMMECWAHWQIDELVVNETQTPTLVIDVEEEDAAPGTYEIIAEATQGLGGDTIDEATTTLVVEDDTVTEISSFDELQALQNNLDADCVLVDDIDAAGRSFSPLGSRDGDQFTGTFDGNGHEIRNLTIDKDVGSERGAGLFGAVSGGGEIRDVGVVEVSITADVDVGCIVGYLDDGTIERAYATGEITGNGSLGGIVGHVAGDGVARESYADVDIGRIRDHDGFNIGGFAGNVQGTIEQSYALGNVDGISEIGGLVGNLQDEWNDGAIMNCYAAGLVSADDNRGGLVGFASGGAGVTESYWDTIATGQGDSEGGTPLTTAEMTGDEAEENMGGFDFSTTWDTTNRYPQLTWQEGEPDPTPPGDLSVSLDPAEDVIGPGESVRLHIEIGNDGGQTVNIVEAGLAFDEEEWAITDGSPIPSLVQAGEEFNGFADVAATEDAAGEYTFEILLQTGAGDVVSDEAPVTVEAVDLSVTAEDDTTLPGGEATIDVTVTNTGDGTATDVDVAVSELPDQWEVETTAGSLGDIDSSESGETTARLAVPADEDAGEYDVDVTAEAASGVTGSDTATVIVEDVGISVSASPDELAVAPGDTATVEFDVENGGDSVLEDVTVELQDSWFPEAEVETPADPLPADWEITAFRDESGTWDNTDREWEVSQIDAGATRTPAVELAIGTDAEPRTHTAEVAVSYNDEVQDTELVTITIPESPTITVQGLALSDHVIEADDGSNSHPEITVWAENTQTVRVYSSHYHNKNEPIELEQDAENPAQFYGSLDVTDSPNVGEMVTLRVEAENEAGEHAVFEDFSQLFDPNDDNVEQQDVDSVFHEETQLQYGVCETVHDVLVVPVRFSDEDEPFRLDQEETEYHYWKTAFKQDLGAYFTGPRGSMGATGFSVVIADQDGDFHQVPQEKDDYRDRAGRGWRRDDAIDTLTSDVQDDIGTIVTDGSATDPGTRVDDFDAWIVTHRDNSVEPRDEGRVSGRMYPSGYGYVYNGFSQVDTWYHELGHAYGLEHLYEYGGVTDKCVMGRGDRDSTDAVNETPPKSTPLRIADTVGLDGLSHWDSTDGVDDWLTVTEEHDIESFDEHTFNFIDISYLKDYEYDDDIEIAVFGDTMFVIEARRNLEDATEDGNEWTQHSAAAVIYKINHQGLNTSVNVIGRSDSKQSYLTDINDDLIEAVTGRWDNPLGTVRFELASKDENRVTVGVERYVPNSRLITADEIVDVEFEIPHNEAGYTPPTLSLTVEDEQGRVVGRNENGEYVNEIPGAYGSGRRVGDTEWVVVPSDVTVDISVSGEDVEQFISDMEATGLAGQADAAEIRTDVTASYEMGVTAYSSDAELVEEDGELTVTGATTETREDTIEPGQRTRVFTDSELPEIPDADTDPSDDTDAPDDTDDSDDGFGPGFGIGGALASLGGLGYLLKQRLNDDSRSE